MSHRRLPGSARLCGAIPTSSAFSSSALPVLATRIPVILAGDDIHAPLDGASERGAAGKRSLPAALALRGYCRALERLNQFCCDWLVRPRVLAGDEFAIHHHVGVEIRADAD